QYHREALQICRQVRDRVGESKILHDLGLLYLEQGAADVALACHLQARNLFKEGEHPIRSNSQQWIDDLREKIGKERFASLLTQVEPQAAQLVEKALQGST